MSDKTTHLVKGVKSVTDFLSDALDAFKELSFVDAIGAALPWAKVVGEATTEALPPLKFITKIAEELLKETDPEKLGMTACTLAYQKAVEIGFSQVGGPAGERQAISEAKDQLRELENLAEIDMGTFSLEAPQQHEFYNQAKLCLEWTAIKVGYTPNQVEDITVVVQDSFRHSLTRLLSDGRTKDNFEPFTEYLKLGGAEEKRARKMLAQHVNYQRWLFEQAPVLRVSPFALKHVYIETDCGKLTWEEINQPQRSHENRINPFSEAYGGRHSLLRTVLDLVGSKQLTEAIIIQGVAGSGKSSLTLKLCDELLERRLHPIRIRIKDLSFDKHIKDALAKAVQFGDENYPEPEPYAFDNLFLDDSIFKERGVGQYEHICKYVLILDGWDEISLSDEGFKKKVAQMLDQINEHYLKQKNPHIRVILTGRPSSDIGDTKCLRDKTPILTVRKFTPEQLEEYIGRLADAVNSEEPLIVRTAQTETWTVPPLSRFRPILEKYKQAFNDEKQKDSGELDVLGLPLITYLTVRLVAEFQGELSPLLENTTTLYRQLIDLTCKEAGKGQVGGEEGSGQYKFYGEQLRHLLRKTAAAITMSGEENISRKELASRLEVEEEDIDTQSSELAKETKLSTLLISFYFKGGHSHLGCEFAHKSFREYLFAEEIVGALKEFGREQTQTLIRRENYWEDFSENRPADLRFKFSRKMSDLLAPQWLTPEVRNHIDGLVSWEIERTVKPSEKRPHGVATEPLVWEEWEQVRTGLADLWEWWGEGVHLRPQPYKEKGQARLKPAFINELIEWDAPRDRRIANWGYARTTTMDAHLGDGLFHLCVLVHAFMANSNKESKLTTPRKYQSVRQLSGKATLSFRPSGEHPSYFLNYVARINGAGWRRFVFPVDTDMRFTDFSGVDLNGAALCFVNFTGARLSNADLSNADLSNADLGFADLSEADAYDADFTSADLQHADLRSIHFYGSDLRLASLKGADLRGASLRSARLGNADLTDADLRGANFNDAILETFEFGYGPEFVETIAKANFDSLVLNREVLDRTTALQRLGEISEANKAPELINHLPDIQDGSGH